MKRMLQFAFFMVLFGLLSVSSFVQGQATQPLVCTRFQQEAFNEFSTACAGTEEGQICYGYNAIIGYEDEDQITMIDDFEVGDKLPIDGVKTVVSEPYDTNNDTWGLSLLQLADVQVTPTQTALNLRYVLFGGVELLDTNEPNTSFEEMQSFVFATDQNDICTDAPSAILIQTTCTTNQDNVRDFRAEGADFTIDGGVLLFGGGTSGFIQVVVISGVLVIQPDVYSDGISEPTDQTQPIVVPVGYTTTAPLNANEPINSEDHIGQWSAIRPLSRQELLDLDYLQNLPGNISYCPIDIPAIVRPSGIGGPVPELSFDSSAPLLPVIPFCQVANPPEFCAYLGLP